MRYLLKRNAFGVVILTLLLSLTIYKPSAAADSDTLFFHAEMVNFASDKSDLSRLDIYTRVNFDDVQFIKTPEGKFLGKYEISASVYDDNDELVKSKQLRETLEVNSIEETASINDYQLSKISFTLPPADYRVAMTLQDLETKREGHFGGRISLKDYSSDSEVMVSGLLYLEFYPHTNRDTVNYVPRLTSIRHQNSNLNAYFEVYNLQENDSVRVQYNIIDEEDKILKSGEYWLKGRGESTQTHFEIDADDLPHGKYLTEVKIKTSTETLKIAKAFDWLIEGVPLTFTLDQAIETLKYIASDQQLEKLQELEGRDKHAAFLDFWEKKDPDPLTRGNDLRRRYYSRIKYANDHFDAMQQEGWRTDMGFVYVMLGPPDEINRAPFISEYLIPGRAVKAAEVWVYYHQSRELLFVDKNGFGEYRLLNTQDFYEMLR